MKAFCWHGRRDVRVNKVADSEIKNPRDAIFKITATAICGSDLKLYNGVMPMKEPGNVIGHEPIG